MCIKEALRLYPLVPKLLESWAKLSHSLMNATYPKVWLSQTHSPKLSPGKMENQNPCVSQQLWTTWVSIPCQWILIYCVLLTHKAHFPMWDISLNDLSYSFQFCCYTWLAS
jgi:hypothetical protein